MKPDKNAAKSENGDEPPRSGVQPEARDADDGRSSADPRDPGLLAAVILTTSQSCSPELSHSLDPKQTPASIPP